VGSSRTITIAPVRKSIVVRAAPGRAFEVFTAGLDRWWPKSVGISASPIKESIIEPFVGGRWYTKCEDGSEVSSGHVTVWDPPHRVVFSWEINSNWKPDTGTPSEVEVAFFEEGSGQTRVSLEHRLFERMGQQGGEKMRGEVDNGWPKLLAFFAAEVDRPAA